MWQAPAYAYHPLPPFPYRVATLAFAGGGEQLLVGTEEGKLVWVALPDGRIRAEAQVHAAAIRTLGFVAGERVVVSGGDDGTVRFGEFVTG